MPCRRAVTWGSLTQQDAAARAREERWRAAGRSRVVSQKYGEVVVPHGSNLAALMNAAEVWGCSWTDIRDAEVWAADPGAVPVPPRMI